MEHYCRQCEKPLENGDLVAILKNLRLADEIITKENAGGALILEHGENDGSFAFHYTPRKIFKLQIKIPNDCLTNFRRNNNGIYTMKNAIYYVERFFPYEKLRKKDDLILDLGFNEEKTGLNCKNPSEFIVYIKR